jgi:hypothetical protein
VLIKGNKAVVGETSGTDPFMTLITPVERYITHACFGTAIMSVDKQVSTQWTVFSTANDSCRSNFLRKFVISVVKPT